MTKPTDAQPTALTDDDLDTAAGGGKHTDWIPVETISHTPTRAKGSLTEEFAMNFEEVKVEY